VGGFGEHVIGDAATQQRDEDGAEVRSTNPYILNPKT
jgi:hypothetical protein